MRGLTHAKDISSEREIRKKKKKKRELEMNHKDQFYSLIIKRDLRVALQLVMKKKINVKESLFMIIRKSISPSW